VDPNGQHDEFYVYDGQYRLKSFQRGSLNAGKTGLTSVNFGQCWTLDTTGNWTNFREDDSGTGSWNLLQNRVSNAVNEILAFSNIIGTAWANPTYDSVGNMTAFPMPLAPASSYSARYDAWNRVVTVAAAGVPIAQYQYDGFGRRTIKTGYLGGVPGQPRHYYHSANWQVLEERVG
jgi:YD repeat-containing protein